MSQINETIEEKYKKEESVCSEAEEVLAEIYDILSNDECCNDCRLEKIMDLLEDYYE